MGPFAKSFLSAALILAAAVAALFTVLGEPGSGSGAGEAIGRLTMTVLVPAVMTGYMARRSAREWSFARIFLLVLILSAAAHVISIFGRASPAAGF